jgi:hypothetical protein
MNKGKHWHWGWIVAVFVIAYLLVARTAATGLAAG